MQFQHRKNASPGTHTGTGGVLGGHVHSLKSTRGDDGGGAGLAGKLPVCSQGGGFQFAFAGDPAKLAWLPRLPPAD